MSKKRKVNLTIYADTEQQKNLENYLETTDMSFLYIENDLGMVTNFRVIKAMSLNEFATFWLSSEKMITLLNNRESVYDWLLSLYDENEPIWKEMRKR